MSARSLAGCDPGGANSLLVAQPEPHLRRLLRLTAAVSGQPCGGEAAPARPWPGADPFTNRSANDPDEHSSAALRHRLAQEPDGCVPGLERTAVSSTCTSS